MANFTTAHYISELCESCAQEIYGQVRPNPAYARAVTDLLLGTIYHESVGFQHTRQMGFSWESDNGAWGIGQCELGSVTDSLAYLKRRPDVAKRAAVWLAGDKDATADWLVNTEPRHVLRWLAVSPQLAVLFVRLHYMRHPDLIPVEPKEMDGFYKKVYNTTAGKARPGDFTQALRNAKGALEI